MLHLVLYHRMLTYVGLRMCVVVSIIFVLLFWMIGWFLSAYFLGGYSKEGRGKNGLQKAVIAAAKSWSLGIPVTPLLFFMCFSFPFFSSMIQTCIYQSCEVVSSL